MEAKELKITPPEGYEIDKEKSTLEHIVFKPVDKKAKTWEEIQELSFQNNEKQFYVNSIGEIEEFLMEGRILRYSTTLNHLNTYRQAERVRALCQLYIITDYYNNGWEADWGNGHEDKYIPYWGIITNKIDWLNWAHASLMAPSFKSKELLMEAYENNKEIFETALKP